MIWDTTTLVGCGMARCSDLNHLNLLSEQVTQFDFIYTVCQYYEAGNYWNELPYELYLSEHDIASNCPDGRVSNSASGLCEVPAKNLKNKGPSNEVVPETVEVNQVVPPKPETISSDRDQRTGSGTETLWTNFVLVLVAFLGAQI